MRDFREIMAVTYYKKIPPVVLVLGMAILKHSDANGQHSRHYTINCITTLQTPNEISFAPALFTPGNEFNDNNIQLSTFKANEQKLRFEGTYNYTVPVQFSYLADKGNVRQVQVSDLLFIDTSTLSISLSSFEKKDHFGIELKSAANEEYKTIKQLYSHLEIFNGSRYMVPAENISKKDLILKDYVRRFSGSFVAMWILIYDYRLYGFTPTKVEIAESFSPTIRQLPVFKEFQKKIAGDISLMKGKRFPTEAFSFFKDSKQVMNSARYVLIDFWASYCKPCLAEFPELKLIYSQFHQQGFQVYTVSIDNEEGMKLAGDLLQAQNIQWKNFFDTSGIQAARYNISAIPRNFLINSDGIIVETNISTTRLKSFLSNKLKAGVAL